ncbi:hypothetical protein [Altererythrobacter aquiaggeris]|uniref:hypothetical protein n=1 Tax=Aestuarierythrobacter aquiaggeris TaxID=1898396 RepID=UPI0030179EBC
MKFINKGAIIAASAGFVFATPVIAQDQYPMTGGDWVEVSAISIDDGHALEYANHLAAQWRQGQDYAVAQGWISSYEVLVNVHPRDGEPDLYLITRFADFADEAESERRGKMYREMMKKNIATLQAESGGRAEFRKLMGTTLMQEMKWRK